MALQMTLDSLDGLDESIQKIYKQGEDGKFHLDVEPVGGHDKNDAQNKDMIPKSRLNQEIEKRKAVEKSLQELIEDVPENKRSIIPDLPPAGKIAWLKTAFKMDFFSDKNPTSIDTKRPSGEPGESENLSPQARMATGYKTK